MPVHFVVRNEGQLVFERWEGEVSREELEAHKMSQFRDESIRPGAKVLSDISRATFSEVTFEDAEDFSEMHDEPAHRSRVGKMALVVHGDEFDKAQHFAAKARSFGVEIMVFTDLEIASIWLGLDPVESRAQIMEMTD